MVVVTVDVAVVVAVIMPPMIVLMPMLFIVSRRWMPMIAWRRKRLGVEPPLYVHAFRLRVVQSRLEKGCRIDDAVVGNDLRSAGIQTA